MATTAQLNQVYLAYFGRPVDVDGANFYANVPIATVVAAFSASPESVALYGSTFNVSAVNAIYQNLFGRPASLTEAQFWVNVVTAPGSTVSAAAAAFTILNNAQNADLTTVNNKLAASAAFTADITTVAQATGYSGTNAAASARAFIATVTASATTIPTQAQIDAALANAVSVGGVAGTVFALTTAVDTLTGTSGNDTFNAVVDYTAGATTTSTATTLNVADTINGGAGTDTLNLTVSGSATGPNGAVTLPLATISGVENVNVRAVTGSTQVITVDANGFNGVTTLSSDRSTDAVTFINVAGTTAIGVIGNGVSTNGATTATFAASAAAPTLNIGGGTVGAGAITITAAGATSFAINSLGTVNNVVGTIAGPATATALTINAAADLVAAGITGAALTKITVSGGAADTVKATVAGQGASAVQIGTVGAAVTTIDASGLTAGGLAATLTAAVTSFKGGAGSDTITTATLTATVASQIDAGAGIDTLVVAASADVSSATKAKEFANFEVLNIAAGQTADASLFTTSAISKIMLGGTNAGVTNLSAAQAANIQIYANETTPVIGVKDATINGNLDTIKFTFDDGLTAVNPISLGAFTAAGVETINVVANDNATLSDLSGATSLTSMTVTGSGNVSISTGALTVNPNSVIDASAVTGTVTINETGATANGLKVLGSLTKANTITGSAQADTIVGGAAADTIVTAGGTDIITTGAGGDNITVSATGALPSSTAFITITDFTKTAGTSTFDTIKAAALILSTQTAAAAAGVATITGGVATFNAADTSFAQHLAAVAAAQQATAGATTIWQEGADSYIFISDGTLAVAATDTLIKLVGVTAGTLTVAGNAITAMA